MSDPGTCKDSVFLQVDDPRYEMPLPVTRTTAMQLLAERRASDSTLQWQPDFEARSNLEEGANGFEEGDVVRRMYIDPPGVMWSGPSSVVTVPE